MSVLVVDDEKDIELIFRQFFKNEINSNDIQFRFAESAEDALYILENKELAELMIILSDINMPGMNGLELLKIVKERFPRIKVYMITAYDDDNNRKTAHEYGCDKYLTKPLDFTSLKELIISEIGK